MTVSSKSESTKKMIQALIKVQEDMLKIPGLSNKQKDDIMKLRQELNALNLQTDESNFKLQLIDIMNRLIKNKT
jgi:F0F1-type ATP synthase alpha subunit